MANNTQNLTHTLTREEQRRGGIRSGEVRRERKKLREELDILLSRKDLQKDICQALVEKALSGDIRAFEVLRDTLGETIKSSEIKFDNEEQTIEVSLSRKNRETAEQNREMWHERMKELERREREVAEKEKNIEQKKEQTKTKCYTGIVV